LRVVRRAYDPGHRCAPSCDRRDSNPHTPYGAQRLRLACMPFHHGRIVLVSPLHSLRRLFGVATRPVNPHTSRPFTHRLASGLCPARGQDVRNPNPPTPNQLFRAPAGIEPASPASNGRRATTTLQERFSLQGCRSIDRSLHGRVLPGVHGGNRTLTPR